MSLFCIVGRDTLKHRDSTSEPDFSINIVSEEFKGKVGDSEIASCT